MSLLVFSSSLTPLSRLSHHAGVFSLREVEGGRKHRKENNIFKKK